MQEAWRIDKRCGAARAIPQVSVANLPDRGRYLNLETVDSGDAIK